VTHARAVSGTGERVRGIVTFAARDGMWGFVVPCDAKDLEPIYVHARDVGPGAGSILVVGRVIDYVVGIDQRGRPCARNVHAAGFSYEGLRR
jgi:cold shock CspA family protein